MVKLANRLSAMLPQNASLPSRADEHWRWPVMLALLVTIPAFYLEMAASAPWPLAAGLYFIAAAVTALALWRSRRAAAHAQRFHARWPQWLLVAGLLVSAALPPSSASPPALAFRLLVALATLARMTWMLRHLVTQGSVAYLLALALAVLGLCGLGFWWLEPSAETLADGLWLAFTTAATVGYGDIVPTTVASKIFSVFVVLLGYGVLSVVTASIAAMWVETEERRIEREILRELHRELKALRADVAVLRDAAEPKRSTPAVAGLRSEREPM
jgi:voltage-gated potassium channel